jgi:SAM-dependent methyltransferase
MATIEASSRLQKWNQAAGPKMTDYASDRERSARLEQTYLTPEIVSRRRQFLPLLGLQEGMHILDVGCGPALLVSEMAALVAPSGSVTGVDPSPDMLELGKRRCHDLIKAGTVTVLPDLSTAGGALTEDEAQRPKALEQENSHLKRIVARPGARHLDGSCRRLRRIAPAGSRR